MQRICVDMDEVMADTLSEHLRRYNDTFDEAVTVDGLAGKGLWEFTPLDRQQQLRAFLDAEDFFEDLPLMPGAQEALKELSARFELFVATQAMFSIAVPGMLPPCTRYAGRGLSRRTRSGLSLGPDLTYISSSTTSLAGGHMSSPERRVPCANATCLPREVSAATMNPL